jgi:NitT/TauT family transport system substrate-binding protein
VRIVEGGVDIDPELELTSGRANVAVIWATRALNLGLQSMPDLVNVAQVFERSGLRTASLKSKGISSASRYRGRKVGVWAGLDTEIRAAAQKSGVNPDRDMALVQIGFTPFGILDDNIDASSVMNYNELAMLYQKVDPSTGQLYKKENFDVVDVNEEGTGMLQDAVVARSSYVAANRDVVVRFLRASFEGWAYCRDNPESCAALFPTPDGATAPHQIWQMAAVNELIWPSSAGIGIMNRTLWNQTTSIGLAYGAFPASGAGRDLSAFYDSSLAREAVAAVQAAGVDAVGAGFKTFVVDFCIGADKRVILCRDAAPPPGTRVIVSEERISLYAIGGGVGGGALVLVTVLLLLWKRRATERSNIYIDPKSLVVGEVIGQGAQGTVHKGTLQGTTVAIKRFVLVSGGGSSGGGGGGGDAGVTGLVGGARAKVYTRGSTRVHDGTGPAWAATTSSADGDGDNDVALLSSLGAAGALVAGKRRPPTQSEAMAAFESELEVIKKFRHPNLIFLLGVVMEKESASLVMEFARGGSLLDLLVATAVPLSWSQRGGIALDVARGLSYLHALDYIHCDLKSPNILLSNTRTPEAKVADFGLAKKAVMGQSKRVRGSIPWMAPELLQGEAPTKSSDVYSFGIILNELCSRAVPYQDICDTPKEVMVHVISGGRSPVSPLWPAPLLKLMDRCLAQQPSLRPTFRDIEGELEAMLPGLQGGEQPLIAAARPSARHLLVNHLLSDPVSVASFTEAGSKEFPEVAVLFCSIVGFTKVCASLQGSVVAAAVGRLFERFDAISEANGVLLLDTIGGDCYISTCGLRRGDRSPARHLVAAGLDMIAATEGLVFQPGVAGSPKLVVRVGIAVGPATAMTLPGGKFTLLGETVSTASRVEQAAVPATLLVTEAVRLACTSDPKLIISSPIANIIKGKSCNTFRITRQQSQWPKPQTASMST